MSTARGSGSSSQAVRRAVARYRGSAQGSAQLLAVTYDRTAAMRSTLATAQRERSLGVGVVQSFDYPFTGLVTRVVSVPAGQLANVQALLRAQVGVRSVAAVGERRFALRVTQPYYTNDPYFNGFTAAVPPTRHVPPYSERANVPGQWDMHAIGLEFAFGYSQASNGSGITSANALGSSNIKIAIIDTGEDPTHPELQAKIVHQKCFITGPNNVQSVSDFAPDPDGHGTDVSGIAAAASNNSLGYAGAGGNSVIYAYRVFPTPSDNCLTPTTTDPQCGSSSLDIAAAINDAVTQHVNVISLSLGGGGCTNGKDGDAAEGNAIANAIAANVVVVAASGNDGVNPVSAPACASGVIAVGASALADGQTNGSNRAGGSASAPIEYVASYSNWGTPAANVHSSSAWGIVAPGADPSCPASPCGDTDALHWISNIWTSTPFDGNFAGLCGDDYPNSASTVPPVDCRVEIAGTSMATPHVAGAVALILAVNASYQSPAKMKQLLCASADDIADAHQGCGRLNLYRAMAVAIGDPSPP